MKHAILGTGIVGQTIGGKLVALGNEVKMGARQAGNEKAAAWVNQAGSRASAGTFGDCGGFGELLWNCTAGSGSIAALRAADGDAGNLRDKLVIDVSNPLDLSHGMPPTLFTGRDDSLGEQIQRAFPAARVVKTLNTMSCNVMVDPERVAGGDHHVFVAGNDEGAKGRVAEILRGSFGWKEVIDLGDITASRATESYLPLWLRLWGALKVGDFNIKVVR
jgi:8-hydroxy-5-deazaflavin:NADPH oxidoreductase